MNAADQCEIIRRVRGFLASCFIDLGLVRVGSTNYTVYLHGRLQRLSGHRVSLTPILMNDLMTQIRRLPQVRGLKAELDDWIEEGGSWRPKTAAAPLRTSPRGSSGGRTLEIAVREDGSVPDDPARAQPLDIQGSRESSE